MGAVDTAPSSRLKEAVGEESGHHLVIVCAAEDRHFLGGGCSLTYSLVWGASEIELHEHHANTKLREGGLHLDTGPGAVASHKALVLEICFHL